MKTSWFIGLMMLYITLYILSSIAAQSNMVTATQISAIQGFMQPVGTDMSSASTSTTGISAAFVLITNVWSYLRPIIEAIFLWNASLWTGNWIWFYYCVCMPISVGMIVSIVFVLRGVANG